MLTQRGNGVYKQPDMITHRLDAPYKSNAQQMKSSSGCYTFFAGHWCWVFNRKKKFYAIIEGKGTTPHRETLGEVACDVTDNKYHR